ncbi:hypothetical protein SAMN05444858_13018 [Micromonospora avicenniae]|uniref:Uncharacterized protein n=1 Tax=Micromonospora avicenniae TaxID=1198245 RepID=A0A1N7F414_9ACTN|nr:hypothetical protein SAMN05444858_13018 [Micromonospora avicenniae]
MSAYRIRENRDLTGRTLALINRNGRERHVRL